jgi:hypothetical protein
MRSLPFNLPTPSARVYLTARIRVCVSHPPPSAAWFALSKSQRGQWSTTSLRLRRGDRTLFPLLPSKQSSPRVPFASRDSRQPRASKHEPRSVHRQHEGHRRRGYHARAPVSASRISTPPSLPQHPPSPHRRAFYQNTFSSFRQPRPFRGRETGGPRLCLFVLFFRALRQEGAPTMMRHSPFQRPVEVGV